MCPICNRPGKPYSKHHDYKNLDNSIQYRCPVCSFLWITEKKCQNLQLDDATQPTCVREGNVGACALGNCTRLKNIRMEYLGFEEASIEIESEMMKPVDQESYLSKQENWTFELTVECAGIVGEWWMCPRNGVFRRGYLGPSFFSTARERTG